ncbi:MAG: GNAT family N-acetyltransferase [Lachnospiraceae bacterium]
MKVELKKRLPDPYTEESAEWWLNMVKEQDGNTGMFRKIVVNDHIIGTISVEQKEDVYRKDAEIGYYLLQEEYSKGIMTESVTHKKQKNLIKSLVYLK